MCDVVIYSVNERGCVAGGAAKIPSDWQVFCVSILKLRYVDRHCFRITRYNPAKRKYSNRNRNNKTTLTLY